MKEKSLLQPQFFFVFFFFFCFLSVGHIGREKKRVHEKELCAERARSRRRSLRRHENCGRQNGRRRLISRRANQPRNHWGCSGDAAVPLCVLPDAVAAGCAEDLYTARFLPSRSAAAPAERWYTRESNVARVSFSSLEFLVLFCLIPLHNKLYS